MSANSNQERSLEAEHWFDKGMKAFQASNFDYAIECLSKAIHVCPDHLEYRKQMHRSSRRKHKRNGGLSKVDSIKLAAIRSRILTAEVKQDWKTIYLLAEDGIAINPWEGPLFAHIAKSATQLDKFEIAKYAWTSAIKLEKQNASYYRAFGALCQAHGEFDLARSCFGQLRGIDPTGRIADELIKSVEVASLLNRGYANAQTAGEMQIGKQPPVARPTDSDDEADDDPATIAAKRLQSFVQLGEQLVQDGKLASAIDAYNNALQLAPANVRLRHRMEDVELAFLRQRALQAQDAARNDPSNERKRGFATQRLTELTSRELAVLSLRVEECPHDLRQAFRLADLYRRCNQLDLAAPLFEAASNDPQLCAEALVGLGECWIKQDGKAEHGRIQLEKVLRLITPETKPNSYKLAHYWLGRLYEARSRFTEADQHYGHVMQLDGRFRDTAERRLAVFEKQTG